MVDSTMVILLIIGLVFLLIQLANAPYYKQKALRKQKEKQARQKQRGNIRLKGKSYYEDQDWDRR